MNESTLASGTVGGEAAATISRSMRWALPALLGGATMWGVSWWPLQSLRSLGVGGVALTLLSTATAALVVAPLAWRQRHCWRLHAAPLLIILLFGGYANLSYILAMMKGNPIRVMMLFYLAPIWAVLGARWFLGERLDVVRIWAVVIAMCGALLILGGPVALGSAPTLIDLLAISAGLTYAINNLAYRKSASLPVLSKNAANFAGSAALALIALLWMGSIAWSEAGHQWWWGALFGLLWLIPAVGMTQYGVSHMPASRSAVLLTLELPIAAVTAWVIGGVRMTPPEMAGGILIVAASLLDSRPRRRNS
jgi:drug/metabolite transporter (DMT)-like permease